MRISQTPALFAEFLHELNETLARDESNEMVEIFLAAALNAPGDSGIFDVTVYAYSPERPVDHFTVEFRQERFYLLKRGRSGTRSAVELPVCKLDELIAPPDSRQPAE